MTQQLNAELNEALGGGAVVSVQLIGPPGAVTGPVNGLVVAESQGLPVGVRRRHWLWRDDLRDHTSVAAAIDASVMAVSAALHSGIGHCRQGRKS